MIIKKVHLKNIRSYVNEAIDFPEGSTMLAGDIGSGKSSILLAIEFALFGIKRGELSGEALLRNGARDATVEVTFSLDDKEIIISRSLKRASDSVKQEAGFIVINNAKENLTPVELKAKIFGLFGYPIELVNRGKDIVFRYTVYTPQEDMKKILYDDNETRLGTLRIAFNVDKYKKIQNNAEFLAKEMRSKIRELSAQIAELDNKRMQLKSIIEETKENNEMLAILTNKHRLKEEQLKVHKEELGEKETKAEEYKEKNSKLEMLQATLRQKRLQQKSMMETIEKTKKDYGLLENRIKSISYDEGLGEAALQKQINEHKKILDTHRIKKTKLGSEIDSNIQKMRYLESPLNRQDLVKKMEEAKSKIAALRKDQGLIKFIKENLRNLEAQLEEKNKELGSVESLIKNSSELKQKISSLDNCPVCRQKVTDDHKHTIIEREESVEADLSNRINGLTRDIKHIMHEKVDAQKKKEEIEQESLEEATLSANLKNFESALLDLEKKELERIRLQKELLGLEAGIAELAKFDEDREQKEILNLEELRKKSIENAKKKEEKENLMQMGARVKENITKFTSDAEKISFDMASLEEEISELVNFIDSNSSLISDFTSARQELEKLLDEDKQLSMQVATKRKEFEGLEKIILNLNIEIEKMSKIKKEIDRLKETNNWIEDHFIHLVSLIEKHIMVTVHQEFSGLFKKWFSMLIEDELMQARLDDSFIPIIDQNGYEVGIENLSGGEKTSCALAYRLALNKVINDLITTIKTRDIIILDEPTDGFSSEQLDKVRYVLDELHMKQIILVSHESKIESFVQNIIRVSKHNHTSEIIG